MQLPVRFGGRDGVRPRVEPAKLPDWARLPETRVQIAIQRQLDGTSKQWAMQAPSSCITARMGAGYLSWPDSTSYYKWGLRPRTSPSFRPASC